MFDSFDTSVSGLVAHRLWLDTIQANMANVHTTRDAQGRPNPYRRRYPIFAVAAGGRGQGVEVHSVEAEEGFDLVKDPGHADAIQSGPMKGYVRMPKVDWYKEMVNGMLVQRAYEANVTALQISRQMYMADLRILA